MNISEIKLKLNELESDKNKGCAVVDRIVRKANRTLEQKCNDAELIIGAIRKFLEIDKSRIGNVINAIKGGGAYARKYQDDYGILFGCILEGSANPDILRRKICLYYDDLNAFWMKMKEYWALDRQLSLIQRNGGCDCSEISKISAKLSSFPFQGLPNLSYDDAKHLKALQEKYIESNSKSVYWESKMVAARYAERFIARFYGAGECGCVPTDVAIHETTKESKEWMLYDIRIAVNDLVYYIDAKNRQADWANFEESEYVHLVNEKSLGRIHLYVQN